MGVATEGQTEADGNPIVFVGGVSPLALASESASNSPNILTTHKPTRLIMPSPILFMFSLNSINANIPTYQLKTLIKTHKRA